MDLMLPSKGMETDGRLRRPQFIPEALGSETRHDHPD
jgi:hypothetical protein